MELSRYKERMQELKLTQLELSKKSQVPIQTIRKIFAGITTSPRLDTVMAIERALGLDERPTVYDIPGIEPLPIFKNIPLVGTIACGTPTLAEQNIEQYIKMDEEINADFALRCKGDSMINARIFSGDIVFIKQQPIVDNGEIAAVLIDSEATLKRVYVYNNRIELRPENPTFPVLNYENDTLKDIRILGKAVAFISTVR